MDPSLTALVVAVVGVAGTLASGVLAHRGALKAKTVELDRAERQRRDEQLAAERREALAARRASYAVFNQRLRQFHSVLSKDYFALAAGEADPDRAREREDPRRVLRDVYAEAQMEISDDVLAAAGGVVHQLHRIHALLGPHERGEEADESLDDIRERLERASEGLYEVRQTMRRDLGVSALPVGRPDGYGAT
ncbi:MULTISPECIES: hypothetical protein [unclassified Streptomyces]|uniref:hypothetical protein n=1 Tax=unclassified Streptomyces TaxID=2593676 RepID=UPI002E2E2694|nr:hypothetical protein [Streptomyces sp. NBC_01423]WSX91080.1 hypothetical protein OH827_11260 [Streptomyces sp. NBC_00891]WSY05558.1 hypothetical protein OG464_11260 [Streptomyces sp. NBC_00890]WSZ07182.1 hypothetical protein OG704_11260 [Streptomyces sp. NBC_00869]WSZ25319.1 hypothetical protein OG498_22305 [Streptomyces sp. NBC_00870]